MVMRAHTQSVNVATGEDINCPVSISVQSFKFILIGGEKGFLVDIRTTHHFLLTMTVQMFCFMSQLILGNPRELKKLACGGQALTLKVARGAGIRQGPGFCGKK